MSDLSYHLEELAIARDPADPRRHQPTITERDLEVLDVGCGIGQTLVTAGFAPGAHLFGVDIDTEALALGKRMFPAVALSASPAESLPFRAASFDLVISRIALPYTNVPRAVAEIHRVLKPNGRVWFVLHALAMELRFVDELRKGNLRGAACRLHSIANGVALHLFGRVFPRPWSGRYGRYQSFQTPSGFSRVMRRAGFVECSARAEPGHAESFVFTARKPALGR